MTLNCIVIDDEPLAAKLLADYVEKTSFLSLIGSFNSAVGAMRIFREKKVDICFLDIQMPELSGLEMAKIIPPSTNIIFTTAFGQYAIDGYKVSATDYLLKPISYESFFESVSRVAKKKTSGGQADESMRSFYVKSDYKLIRINYDDILYVEGEKDYVKIYVEGGEKPILTLLNLKKMEDYLPKPEFMRTHRSYIVHIPKAKEIEKMHFVVGDKRIPISETYKSEVTSFLEDLSL